MWFISKETTLLSLGHILKETKERWGEGLYPTPKKVLEHPILQEEIRTGQINTFLNVPDEKILY